MIKEAFRHCAQHRAVNCDEKVSLPATEFITTLNGIMLIGMWALLKARPAQSHPLASVGLTGQRLGGVKLDVEVGVCVQFVQHGLHLALGYAAGRRDRVRIQAVGRQEGKTFSL